MVVHIGISQITSLWLPVGRQVRNDEVFSQYVIGSEAKARSVKFSLGEERGLKDSQRTNTDSLRVEVHTKRVDVVSLRMKIDSQRVNLDSPRMKIGSLREKIGFIRPDAKT